MIDVYLYHYFTETEPIPPVLKVNVTFRGATGRQSTTQPLKFSPAFLMEEIVEQIVALFIYLGHIEGEAERKYLNYALFRKDEYLHKDKSAVELQLEEGVCVLKALSFT